MTSTSSASLTGSSRWSLRCYQSNGCGISSAVSGGDEASGGKSNVHGKLVRQEDRVRDPKHYLRPVDEIEAMTGPDFLPELEDGLEERLESAGHATLWG